MDVVLFRGWACGGGVLFLGIYLPDLYFNLIILTPWRFPRNAASLQFTFHYDDTNSKSSTGKMTIILEFTFHYDNTNSPFCIYHALGVAVFTFHYDNTNSNIIDLGEVKVPRFTFHYDNSNSADHCTVETAHIEIYISL